MEKARLGPITQTTQGENGMKYPLTFTEIDLRGWSRGEIFYYFSKMAPTGYSITTQVDVTSLRHLLQARGLKFFPAYLWLVTKTLMEQEAFCLSMQGDTLGRYNTLTPLYATFHEEEKTFSLLWTEYDDSFPAFYRAYLENKQLYGESKGILGQKGMLPPPNAYTISCIPWVSFDHFAVHSYENKPYFLPSVEAGKFTEKDGRLMMPLSLTCHHAATDGYHVQKFLSSLQRYMDRFEDFLCEQTSEQEEVQPEGAAVGIPVMGKGESLL